MKITARYRLNTVFTIPSYAACVGRAKFFSLRLFSMHIQCAKRVNIGRNLETENPIGPHFIACSRKKAAVTPYFFIKLK
jgi:hypothetical protein